MCPSFGNLKTLSLGEWCMAADFDALIFLLQHSPNIQKLFLQLKIVCVITYLGLMLTWLFFSFEYLNTCLTTTFLIRKRTSIPERYQKQVSNYREDHLLAKIFEWWRSHAQRMMGESISWQICLWQMVCQSRKFMSATAGMLVSHTFSSDSILYLFSLSVLLLACVFLCYLLTDVHCILSCSAFPEKPHAFMCIYNLLNILSPFC